MGPPYQDALNGWVPLGVSSPVSSFVLVISHVGSKKPHTGHRVLHPTRLGNPGGAGVEDLLVGPGRFFRADLPYSSWGACKSVRS